MEKYDWNGQDMRVEVHSKRIKEYGGGGGERGEGGSTEQGGGRSDEGGVRREEGVGGQ